MGKYFLSLTGNFVILFYCAVFGAAFLVASTVYLGSLEREKNSDPLCIENVSPLDEIGTTPAPPESKCERMKEWKCYATTGLIYGTICVCLGIMQLWPICWNICFPYTPRHEDTSGSGHAHKRLEGKYRQVHFGLWSACYKCFGFFVKYVLMSALWLASFLIPAYIAFSLGSSNAVHGEEKKFYWPSLSLFIICLLSLVFATVSACALVCVRGDYWGKMDTSSGFGRSDSSQQNRELVNDLEAQDEHHSNHK